MRFVGFYVVSADNAVGWSGQKMQGLNFCPSPPLHSPNSNKSTVLYMVDMSQRKGIWCRKPNFDVKNHDLFKIDFKSLVINYNLLFNLAYLLTSLYCYHYRKKTKKSKSFFEKVPTPAEKKWFNIFDTNNQLLKV